VSYTSFDAACALVAASEQFLPSGPLSSSADSGLWYLLDASFMNEFPYLFSRDCRRDPVGVVWVDPYSADADFEKVGG
jgi:hypothetical protein